MYKAFSLLELIIVILVIALLSSFVVSKYNHISENTNFTKLKSDVVLIQNQISKLKQKNILLNKSEEELSLENVEILKNSNWTKEDNNFLFTYSKNEKIKFKFKDNSFICIKPIEICKELP